MRTKIALTFILDEEVTPDIFASKVAQACIDRGALRKGEGIQLPSNPKAMFMVDPKDRTVLKEPLR